MAVLDASFYVALMHAGDEHHPAAHRKVVDQLIEARLVAIWPLDEELGARAAHLAIAARLKGADAVYLAVAERLDEALVTFDREVFERGAGYVDTIYPAS